MNNAGAARLSNSKAYCEGMLYRTTGNAITASIDGNPHVAGSPDGDAWDRGWTKAQESAGGNIPKSDMGCCSVPPSVVA